MLSFENQTAVITGGSRGIGAATALMFAQAGANIVVNYLNRKDAALEIVETAKRFGVGGLAVQADVSKLAQVKRLIGAAEKKFGGVDILVANAGVWEGAPIDELDEALWDRVVAMNLKSVYACCHVTAQLMKRQKSGKMILVSSTAGQRGEANYSCYAATKGAVISFTKSICVELGPFGVNVNCVAPGWVDTDMAAFPLRDKRQRRLIESQIPLGRVASPEDIAGAILFLASDLAQHITGEVLNVNGGSVLCG
jgi:3-oxoacyl-[acyl-carrier protein] reductase